MNPEFICFGLKNIDESKPTVAIDVDGCLLDIYKPLTIKLWQSGTKGFSMNRVLTYDWNKSLSADKAPDWLIKTSAFGDYYLNAFRKDIIELLKCDDVFLFAEFYSSICVGLLEKLSKVANVVINTASWTESIRQIKIDKLSSISGISGRAYLGAKEIVENADYVIDDCIAELDAYPDGVKKFLVNAPYNQERYNDSKNNFEDIIRSIDVTSAIHEIFCRILSERKS